MVDLGREYGRGRKLLILINFEDTVYYLILHNKCCKRIRPKKKVNTRKKYSKILVVYFFSYLFLGL